MLGDSIGEGLCALYIRSLCSCSFSCTVCYETLYLRVFVHSMLGGSVSEGLGEL